MQTVHDEAGQALVMHEQALTDRIGILLCDRHAFFEDLFRSDAALDLSLFDPGRFSRPRAATDLKVDAE